MSVWGERLLRVLLFGSSGQTGSYLAQEMISQGHFVIGVARSKNKYIPKQISNFSEIIADPTHEHVLGDILTQNRFDTVVNLLSVSSVSLCSEYPELSYEVNFLFAQKLFDKILEQSVKEKKPIRLLHASSSEMYGAHPSGTKVSESLEINPTSVYGHHKSLAHNYLEKLKTYSDEFLATSLILFNHESPRRGDRFVSRKIIDTIYEITQGTKTNLQLGDLEVLRDWGYARDFAIGIEKIAQARTNSNFVLGTGKLHSVGEFCDEAFRNFNVPESKQIIVSSEALKRSSNNNGLAADTSRVFAEIGWQPTVSFEDLVKILVQAKLGLVSDF
jgi:GDPmannose 4,6-dehydratase